MSEKLGGGGERGGERWRANERRAGRLGLERAGKMDQRALEAEKKLGPEDDAAKQEKLEKSDEEKAKLRAQIAEEERIIAELEKQWAGVGEKLLKQREQYEFRNLDSSRKKARDKAKNEQAHIAQTETHLARIEKSLVKHQARLQELTTELTGTAAESAEQLNDLVKGRAKWVAENRAPVKNEAKPAEGGAQPDIKKGGAEEMAQIAEVPGYMWYARTDRYGGAYYSEKTKKNLAKKGVEKDPAEEELEERLQKARDAKYAETKQFVIEALNGKTPAEALRDINKDIATLVMELNAMEGASYNNPSMQRRHEKRVKQMREELEQYWRVQEALRQMVPEKLWAQEEMRGERSAVKIDEQEPMGKADDWEAEDEFDYADDEEMNQEKPLTKEEVEQLVEEGFARRERQKKDKLKERIFEKMKKSLVGVLMGAMLLSLTACAKIDMKAANAAQAGLQDSRPAVTEMVQNDGGGEAAGFVDRLEDQNLQTGGGAEAAAEAEVMKEDLRHTAPNGLKYLYDWFEVQKNGTVAYGPDMSALFGDEEGLKEAMLQMAQDMPEVFLTFVEKIGPVLEAGGFSADTKIADIEARWSHGTEDVGEEQAKMVEKFAEMVKNAQVKFYRENNKEYSYYLYQELTPEQQKLVKADKKVELTPGNMRYDVSEASRTNAPQAQVIFTDGNGRMWVLDLNLSCGLQPNLGYVVFDKGPSAKPVVPVVDKVVEDQPQEQQEDQQEDRQEEDQQQDEQQQEEQQDDQQDDTEDEFDYEDDDEEEGGPEEEGGGPQQQEEDDGGEEDNGGGGEDGQGEEEGEKPGPAPAPVVKNETKAKDEEREKKVVQQADLGGQMGGSDLGEKTDVRVATDEEHKDIVEGQQARPGSSEAEAAAAAAEQARADAAAEEAAKTPLSNEQIQAIADELAVAAAAEVKREDVQAESVTPAAEAFINATENNNAGGAGGASGEAEAAAAESGGSGGSEAAAAENGGNGGSEATAAAAAAQQAAVAAANLGGSFGGSELGEPSGPPPGA